MAFIVKTDLFTYIDESIIDQLTDGNDAIVTEVISDAEIRLTEKIGPRYDMAIDLAKVGADRNRSLLKHCINLSIYYLFQRLYTDVLPEGRTQGMLDAEKWLDDVFNGKLSVNLTPVSDAEQTGWPLRWGSDIKKGSQNY